MFIHSVLKITGNGRAGVNPKDIPAHPETAHRKQWKGIGDWLGTIANQKGKKDEMLSRWAEWGKEWSNARTDPNGQIREKGKHLVSELDLTLANCGDNLGQEDKELLSGGIDVINTEIEKNIDYGPPCDP